MTSDPSPVGAADRVPGISRVIDRLNDGIGRSVAWLSVLMVAVAAFNALARYVGRFTGVNLSSNSYLELQWYLFSMLFLLGGAWALREGAHVRVDLLHSRWKPRTQALVDCAGTLFLLLPFSIFTFWVSIPAVRNSIAVREISPDPGGLPRYPLKALILVCFGLLILQGISEFAKGWARVRAADPGGRASVPPSPAGPGEG